MTVTESVRRAGGIVRLRTLRHHGWSERAVRRAVDARELVRPRKGWVALPGADPLLLSATRAGVVISCVTRAQRMGLWVLDAPDRPHVAAPPCSSTVHIGTDAATGEPKAVVHWAQPIVPRHPDAVEDTIENTLALVAGCVPFEEALAVWESALDKRLGKVSSEAQEKFDASEPVTRVLDVDTVVICAGQESVADTFGLDPAKVTVIGGADVAAELDAKRAIKQATELAAAL